MGLLKKISGLILLFIMGAILFNACNEDEPTNAQVSDTEVNFNPEITYGTVTDQEGNEYKTVTIGTQTWMAENLRTTKYRNGDSIPEIQDSTAWVKSTLKTGAYSNYANTTNGNDIKMYGRLYNWYTVVDTRNLAPEGWHVADTTEWNILIDHLQSRSIAGGKLKEIGTTHWKDLNIGATNETGFTALPAGYRKSVGGSFSSLGKSCVYWTTTKKNTTESFGYNMLSEGEGCYQVRYKQKFGFSVRCVKD